MVNAIRSIIDLDETAGERCVKRFPRSPQARSTKWENMLLSQCKSTPFALKMSPNIHLFSSRTWNATFKKAKMRQILSKIVPDSGINKANPNLPVICYNTVGLEDNESAQ